MCGDGLELQDPALPQALHGKAGIGAFARDIFHASPTCCSSRWSRRSPPSHQPGTAWLPHQMRGTSSGDWAPLDLAATGARIDLHGVTRWRFRGKLLVRWDTIYDNLDLARQTGVPPQGSRADRLFSRLQHLQARGQRRRATRGA
jgi:hypothetical protein